MIDELSNAVTQPAENLERRYGLVIPARDLVRLLGYRTSAAFRQAVRRQTLGLHTFFIDGRRGRYARAVDVAVWLTKQGQVERRMP